MYNLLTQSACSVSHARVLAEPAQRILSVGRQNGGTHHVHTPTSGRGHTLKSVVGPYAGSIAQEEHMVL